MKRFIAITLAVLMLAALLCACGENNSKGGATVTTTVEAKYDDGYAKRYASSTSTDDNGNTVYEFEADKYDTFRESHNNTLSKDMQHEVAEKRSQDYGEYIYIKEEKNAVIVGAHKDKYVEKEAEEDAAMLAEYGFRYFQNLQKPVDTIQVIYCNANDQNEIFGTFEFTAN